MIPASYLFKHTYHQHWEQPDAPVVTETHHRFFDGLLTPVKYAAARLRHFENSFHHRPTGFAYD